MSQTGLNHQSHQGFAETKSALQFFFQVLLFSIFDAIVFPDLAGFRGKVLIFIKRRTP